MSEEKVLVLTQYPVVDQLRDKLSNEIGTSLEYLVVSTLAADGYSELIKRLRRDQFDRVYVLITDRTVIPLQSILKLISFVVRGKRRFLIRPQEDISEFGWTSGILDAAGISLTVLLGLLSMVQLMVRGLTLLVVPRVRFDDTPGPDFKKKFAYVRSNLWLGVQAGGALTHTWGVVRGLTRTGSKVMYLSADQRGYEGEGNFEHVPIEPQHPYIIPRELNHFLYHKTFVAKSVAALKDFRGTVYQRISIGNFAGVEISRRYRCPLVLEYNGSESWLARNWGTPFLFTRIVELAENVSLRHAHVIVTVSEPLKQELIARGVDENRIAVHPNGVDPDDFDPSNRSDDQKTALRAELGIPNDAIIVSFVGTFGPWHGAEILAKAANKIAAHDSDKDIYFLFIGDGVRRPEVEKFAGSVIESGKVILTGLVEPAMIPSYLAISDILAAPTVENPDRSPFFGSPTKLFEYMAASKPIVASDIGQISTIMSGSPNSRDLANLSSQPDRQSGDQIGVLTTPGDVDELTAAILWLSKNADFRKVWGNNARRRVLQKFTWDNHVQEILSKIDEQVTIEVPRRVRLLINALHSKSGGGVTYLTNMLPKLTANKELDVKLCIHQSQIGLYRDVAAPGQITSVKFRPSLIRLIVFEQLIFPFIAVRSGADVTFSPANYGPLILRRSVILLRNAMGVALVERRLSKIIYWGLVYMGTWVSSLRASRAISVSKYALESTSSAVFGDLGKKFEIIPHGVNSKFTPAAFSDRDTHSLLCVSDLYVQKNIHTLFNALPTVAERYPEIRLTIAGSPVDRQYAQMLRRIVGEMGLSNIVEFVGMLNVDDLRKQYHKATIFVFPSTVETFGNPLVEAMACGCPIVSSNTAAMPEVAGDAAAYFDPRDSEDVARVIIDLLENPDKREALSARAIERSKMYSWDETARKTAEILIEAAKS